MKTTSVLARAGLDAATAIDERFPGYRERLVLTFAEAIKRYPEGHTASGRQRAIEKLIDSIDQDAPNDEPKA
jgi:hypothetical protein